MKKALLILLTVGLCLLLLGGGTFVVALGAAGWDIKAFSSVQTETKTFTENAEAPLSSIVIDYENADLTIVLGAENTAIEIEYPLAKNLRGKYASEVTATEENGALTIVERSNWRSYLSMWNFSEPRLTVTVPANRAITLFLDTDNGDVSISEGEYAFTSLHLQSDNGDIQAADASLTVADELYMETDNGDIQAGAFSATNASLSTDNGDVSLLGNATASGKLKLETNNGDVKFKGAASANELSAETDNGDIDGDGVLTAEKISLETAVGDIEIALAGAQADYTVEVERDLGEYNIVSGGSGAKMLFVSTDVGDIEVSFAG